MGNQHGNMNLRKPPGAGKSSFELIDSTRLFSEVHLSEGRVLLDMGCGRGLYAIAAAKIVGNEGLVYAIDLWDEGIAFLREQAAAEDVHNLRAMVADTSKRTVLADASVDICLLATVFHDLVQIQASEGTLREIARVLKPEGLLAIVEFKKMEGPPGPPMSIRLSPDEVAIRVNPRGFKSNRVVDVGPYNYLMTFSLDAADRP